MSQAIENRLDNAYVIADCMVKVGGQNVSNDLMDKIMLVEVQQNLYLPAMFTIHIYSPDLELFETNPFNMGAEVSIFMSQDTSSQKIMVGEVTTVEIDADVGTPLLIVRGYDRLHRLQRGRKTRTFAQVKDSDLVTKLAIEGALTASVASTSGLYDYIL